MLVVDAERDTWVPVAGGDLLYERLGRPDPEARVRVAPMVGVTTQGLAVSGRF